MKLSPRSSTAPVEGLADSPVAWWQTAVVYEVYVRSFADGNGDGIGDLEGVRSRLGYLRDLGVDALWFTPWYASPWVDGGYDVADYRQIHPDFGTVAEAETLIAEAAGLGIRTIVDVVPNHVSSQHSWFREALASAPGSEARSRFWFRPGRGVRGQEPPTRWPSSFSGETWTRTTNADGSPGEWYLHLFDAEQPDLNWDDPTVRNEFEDVLRFWFDRGVAGVRVDSAAFLVKDPGLPEMEAEGTAHPFLDRDEIHDIYRRWRLVTDEYPQRALVGEIWLPDLDRFARYLRPDELHMAFNFDFMVQPWDAGAFRHSIVETLAVHERVGAPATWVLSNHDITRPVTRYGRDDSAFSFETKRFGIPTDLERGTARARAAALLTGALPGVLYVYQGDELGLPEAEDLPTESRHDPMFFRSEGRDPGREGCRVPLPWTASGSSFGFSSASSGGSRRPWLPQPGDWGAYSVEAERADPRSMLSLYTGMIRLRRDLPDLTDEPLEWLPSDDDVLAFRRGAVSCVVNMSDHGIELPLGARVLIGSAPVAEGALAPDTAVWLHGESLPGDTASLPVARPASAD
ncbi:glycoside hydrolase family 13 protein [Humibacter ginsenosidimutans]|uniref:Glycoside hydrolase family 13 protein n=1 Tax=Humibacter ginsenosidimutans TaxID=2599293 RepID=A0A5B8M736_9MICO|nr:alpha-amylase family glycosyl hydrolase [Humibacter ginsenosidimutans]QDZ16001.1 glycoside hydrolase family 13 protein [Humibacter ginsenosidimutans]